MVDNPHLPGSRDEFIRENLRLVHKVASKYKLHAVRATGVLIDYDDLYSIGSIGLIKAYNNYDPTKFENVTRFSTYAVPMIVGEIKRYIRDSNPGPKFSRPAKESYAKIVKYDLVRESPEDISRALDMSLDLVKMGLAYGRYVYTRSMNEVVFENNGDPVTLEDTVADHVDFHISLELKELLSSQDPRSVKCLLMYNEGYTQAEIGETMGISQVQVGRLIKRVLEKLRNGETTNMGQWGNKKEALRLLAETDLSIRQIAQRTGCSKNSVAKWAKGDARSVVKNRPTEEVTTPVSAPEPVILVAAKQRANELPQYMAPPPQELPHKTVLGVVPDVISPTISLSISLSSEEAELDLISKEIKGALDIFKSKGIDKAGFSFTIG